LSRTLKLAIWPGSTDPGRSADRLGCSETHTMGQQFPRVGVGVRPTGTVVRFGTFELDLGSGELKRNGRRVPIQDQPARALCVLASRPGQLVTRDDLRKALWSADTFLEFDTALNIVVTKLRHALGDLAASPRFIETIPKRGYRFIADVHRADATPDLESTHRQTPAPEPIGRSAESTRGRRPDLARRTGWFMVALLVGVSAGAGVVWWPDPPHRPIELSALQLEVDLGTDVSLQSGTGPSVAISPDGGRLVLMSDRRLMMRRLNHRSSTAPLAGTDGATSFSSLLTANRWRSLHKASSNALRSTARRS